MQDEPTAGKGVSRDEALMFLNDRLDGALIAVLSVDVGEEHPAVIFSASGILEHYGRRLREYDPTRKWSDHSDHFDGMYSIERARGTLAVDEHFRDFRFAENGALDIVLAAGVTLRVGTLDMIDLDDE